MKTIQEHAGFIKAMIQAHKDELNVAVPARIVNVYPRSVDIIPEIYRSKMLGDRTREYTETPIIYDVPTVILGCADWSISIPLSPGCKGLYIHADYDIDNWWQNGNPIPETARTHDINDGFFIPTFNGGDNTVDCIEIRTPGVTYKFCPDDLHIV